MPVIEVNNIQEARIYFLNHNTGNNTCIGIWKKERKGLTSLNEALKFYGYTVTDYTNKMNKKDKISTEFLTMRDYFAAKAMQSLLFSAEDVPFFTDSILEEFAKDAYNMSDAMLKERQKRK